MAAEHPSVVALRNEIAPALIAYRISSIEAAYSDGGIAGIQFRDDKGFRVERLQLPPMLLGALEAAFDQFIQEQECLGEGVVAINLVAMLVTRSCQAADDHPAVLVQWRL